MLPAVDLLRALSAPLRSADTYRRWVYFVVGGALYVPFAMSVFVFVTLFDGGSGSIEDGVGPVGLASAAVAAVLGGSTAWLPSVRRHQHQFVRSLIRGPLADDPVLPADGRRTRWRASVWTALHLAIGFAVCLATMVLLTEAAMLALSAVVEQPATLFSGRLWFLASGAPTGIARLLGPLAGALLLMATIASMSLVGAGAARLAPMLLGPSLVDRLAAAEERASKLTHRSQLAAELHDSLGHALSVVALQAGRRHGSSTTIPPTPDEPSRTSRTKPATPRATSITRWGLCVRGARCRRPSSRSRTCRSCSRPSARPGRTCRWSSMGRSTTCRSPSPARRTDSAEKG